MQGGRDSRMGMSCRVKEIVAPPCWGLGWVELREGAVLPTGQQPCTADKATSASSAMSQETECQS